MKNSIIILSSLFLLLIGTVQIHAQDFNTNKNNYLVLSKNIEQINPILLTANDLIKEDGEKFGDFYIIFCGKTVNDIIDNNDFEKLLKHAKTQNVKVLVCGISLKKFNVNPNQLPPNLEITDNGILHAFQLTKKGFYSLTI